MVICKPFTSIRSFGNTSACESVRQSNGGSLGWSIARYIFSHLSRLDGALLCEARPADGGAHFFSSFS